MAVDYIAPFSYTLEYNTFTLRDGNDALLLEGRVFGSNGKDLRDILQRTVDCLNALDKFTFESSPVNVGMVTDALNQRLPIITGNVLRVATEAASQQSLLSAKQASNALAAMEALKANILNSVQGVANLQNQISQKAAEVANIAKDADEIIAAAAQTRINAANVASAIDNLNESVQTAQSAASNAAITLAQIKAIQTGLAGYVTRDELTAIIAQQEAGDMEASKNLSDLTNVPAARANLGLGSLALQNVGTVNISGGTIEGTAIGVQNAAAGRFTTLYATDTLALRASVGNPARVPARFATGSKLINPVVPNAMEWDGILLYMTQMDGTRRPLAYLDSPTFSGSPRGPTPPPGNSSTLIPTTAWVQQELIARLANYTPGSGTGGGSGDVNSANANITGGQINGTTIGLTNPRAAHFTELTIAPEITYGRMMPRVFCATTTGAGAALLSLNSTGNITTIVIPNNGLHTVKMMIGARQTGGGDGTINDAAVWEFSFAVKRSNGGACSIIGYVAKMLIAYDDATIGWDVNIVDGATGFQIAVNGQANKQINWVATVITTEIA